MSLKNPLFLLASCFFIACGGTIACGGSVIETPAVDTDTGSGDDTSGGETTPGDTTIGPDSPPSDILDDTTIGETTPPADAPADVILPVDGACPTGLTLCGAGCVDLKADTTNCGKCGKVCPAGATCATSPVGTSACTCPAGQIICGSKCADVSTDTANCGGCGVSCGSGGTCVSGKCVCGGGATTCGTSCADITKDPLNCGGCGKRCSAFGTCTASSCSCPAASTICTIGGRTYCADTNADPDFCGTTGCGTRCGNRDYCDGTGKCVCRPGLTSCTIGGGGGGAICLNTEGSPFACGACGTACTGGQICSGGKCQPGGTACPTGETKCTFGGGGGGASGCYNLQKENTHCGTCGNECAQDEICTAGVCKPYIPATSCTSCPCADCATFFSGGGETATCCPKLPGHAHPICVRGTACP